MLMRTEQDVDIREQWCVWVPFLAFRKMRMCLSWAHASG